MAVSTKSKITYNSINYRVVAIQDWAGYGGLNGDDLLEESCTHYAWTGITEDASYDATDAYSAAETLACMAANPSREWRTSYPDVDITTDIELWLPAGTGMCMKALCRRVEGVTA